MRLFDWLRSKPRHPLYKERRDLANQLSGWDMAKRAAILEKVSRENPELYESWMLEPYPGRGDR